MILIQVYIFLLTSLEVHLEVGHQEKVTIMFPI